MVLAFSLRLDAGALDGLESKAMGVTNCQSKNPEARLTSYHVLQMADHKTANSNSSSSSSSSSSSDEYSGKKFPCSPNPAKATSILSRWITREGQGQRKKLDWEKVQKELRLRLVAGLGAEGPVLLDIEQPIGKYEGSGVLKFAGRLGHRHLSVDATLSGHPAWLLRGWLANGGESQLDLHWSANVTDDTNSSNQESSAAAEQQEEQQQQQQQPSDDAKERIWVASMRVRDVSLSGAQLVIPRQQPEPRSSSSVQAMDKIAETEAPP